MSLRSAPYWWVECDLCRRRSDKGLGTRAHVLAVAKKRGWHVEGGNHLCPDCTPQDRSGHTRTASDEPDGER